MPKCSGSTSRPARAAASWMRRRARPASAGVSCAPSHPSAIRPTRSSALGPRPPSHTSSGSCTGRAAGARRSNDQRSERWSTASPAHQLAQQPEHLLEHLAAAGAVEPQRLALARLVEPGDEAEQQPAAGDLVELRELLGQQERVAAERHDVGAEPQAAGPPGGERQRRAAGRATGATRRSDSHIPSKPLASSDSANAANSAPERDPACGPTAKRIFMPSQPTTARQAGRVLGEESTLNLPWRGVSSCSRLVDPAYSLKAWGRVRDRGASGSGGNYSDSAGNQNPLVDWRNGSTWSVDPGPAMPAGTVLDGVSCASDGSCTVVGYYFMTYPGGETQPAPVSAQLS